MGKLFKFLKPRVGAVLAIVAVLIIQAYCDLSLPGYTSDIVNVGIQQGGIDSAIPEQIAKDDMEKLLLFVSKDDQRSDIMFEKAAYDNKTVAVHFSVGEKESAIISHMQLNPVNITVNDNIITFEEGTAEHYIDISQFDSVKCDDECVNDIADATIDMMCDHWSVHFDILTI